MYISIQLPRSHGGNWGALIRSNAPSTSKSFCCDFSYAYPFASLHRLLRSFRPLSLLLLGRRIVVAVACWRWQTAWRQRRRRRIVVAAVTVLRLWPH